MAITKRRYPGRKDTIWGYCFDQPGSTRKNRKQITATGFTTKALAVAAEAKRRLAAGIVHDSVTLAELLGLFIMRRAAKLAPKTVEHYRETIPYLDAALLAMPMHDITARRFNQEWERLLASGGLGKRLGKPLGPKFVKNIAAVVSSAYGWAIFQEMTQINPITYSRAPHVPKKQAAPRIVNLEDQATLLSASRHMSLPVILELTAATGARRGEVLALRWSDIKDGCVTIARSLSQTDAGLEFKSTKTGNTRAVYIEASTLAVLQQHRARQLELRRQFGPDYRADLDLICCQSDGSPYKPDSVSSLTWNLKERLLLPKGTSLHALRHARASYALEDGASIATVSEMLGHASPATTMGIYAHSIKGADKAAAEAFEQRRRRVLASVSEMSVN